MDRLSEMETVAKVPVQRHLTDVSPETANRKPASLKEVRVSLTISSDMLSALGRAAQSARSTPSEYLRATLRSALDRTPARLRADDEIVRLAINLAENWHDLQTRLRTAGYILRLTREGFLTLHTWPLNKPIMQIEEMGLTKASLVLKFRAPFPGEIISQKPEHPQINAEIRCGVLSDQCELVSARTARLSLMPRPTDGIVRGIGSSRPQ